MSLISRSAHEPFIPSRQNPARPMERGDVVMYLILLLPAGPPPDDECPPLAMKLEEPEPRPPWPPAPGLAECIDWAAWAHPQEPSDAALVEVSRAALALPNLLIEGAVFTRILTRKEMTFFAGLGNSELATPGVQEGTEEIDRHRFDDHRSGCSSTAAREPTGNASISLPWISTRPSPLFRRATGSRRSCSRRRSRPVPSGSGSTRSGNRRKTSNLPSTWSAGRASTGPSLSLFRLPVSRPGRRGCGGRSARGLLRRDRDRLVNDVRDR